MKKTYNILDFGAVADGKTLNSEAIICAVNACYENGGGEVTVPAGDFLVGDIVLHSGVTLHLLSGAKLIGSRDPMDYFHYRNDKYDRIKPEDIDDEPWARQNFYQPNPPGVRHRVTVPGCRWSNAIIRAWNSENIGVIGDEGSVIDGMDCYDKYGEECYRGPHGMSFHNCKNITLSGYTIKRTGNWAHNTVFCEGITMSGVTVLEGHDGIHMSECRNIIIKDSDFFTGDDSIAGFGNVNVLVSGCEINSACSAFRFGGTNVLITGCHMFAPAKYGFRGAMSDEDKAASAPSPTSGIRNNMLSAITYYSDYSLPIEYQPGNIVVENCRIEMADRFIHFNFSGNERWQANRPMTDITFRNIKAEGISMPITAYGAENSPFTIRLADTEIGVREGAELTALIHACNCELVELTRVKLKGFKGDCLVRTWSEIPVRADVEGAECELVKAADVEFTAKPI